MYYSGSSQENRALSGSPEDRFYGAGYKVFGTAEKSKSQSQDPGMKDQP